MARRDCDTPAAGTDWLGFPARFKRPARHALVPFGDGSAPVLLAPLLNGFGDAVAREATETALWHDGQALHLRATCTTAALQRVRDLASPNEHTSSRDGWGGDALEVQVDVGLTRREYLHAILPPTGVPVTYRGFNNRQTQGCHPVIELRVTFGADAWIVEATFPFRELGKTPAEGEQWGLNLMRANPAEPGGYVQWSPTLGDALRPELFGTITFGGPRMTGKPDVVARDAAVDACKHHAAERREYFLSAVNSITDARTLAALGREDWASWADHLARRDAPLPLRWDALRAGVDGIPAPDRDWALRAAETAVKRVGQWQTDPPSPPTSALDGMEALGDAFLLTGEQRFVDAFERAVEIYAAGTENAFAELSDTPGGHAAADLYHDYQLIRAGMAAYAYVVMREAHLAPQTHAVMMRCMLRYGRYSAFNISTAYTYGNHQVYESSGLALVALLFPEFAESDEWARIAGRAIRIHLEREVDPDGGYMERCGYHGVAMGFVMQALTAIHVNGSDARFADLTAPGTAAILTRMHEWLLHMMAPDGTLPAFGDYRPHCQLRFLLRGAAVLDRPAWMEPVHQLAPDMELPPRLAGTLALQPAPHTDRPPSMQRSVSLEHSGFSVMRSGGPDGLYMAVDHGPLGGQHSHPDSMGFVAYAFGRAIALDAGIGITYEDARYVSWFRSVRAHNVVAIDDIEPEKVAWRTDWHADGDLEFLQMRSDAYFHTLGVRRERRIVFVRNVGWLIHDAIEGDDLEERRIDWLLHSPLDLQCEEPGLVHGGGRELGLLVLAAEPDALEPSEIDDQPAALPVPAAAGFRQVDAHGRIKEGWMGDIAGLSWRHRPAPGPAHFTVFLLPYRGDRPAVRLAARSDAWELTIEDRQPLSIPR